MAEICILFQLVQGLRIVDFKQGLDEDRAHLQHLQRSALALLPHLAISNLLEAQKCDGRLQQLVGLLRLSQE